MTALRRDSSADSPADSPTYADLARSRARLQSCRGAVAELSLSTQSCHRCRGVATGCSGNLPPDDEPPSARMPPDSNFFADAVANLRTFPSRLGDRVLAFMRSDAAAVVQPSGSTLWR